MLGLRITDKEITAYNAYLIELLALAAGYRLIENEVSREGIRTDRNLARQVINDEYARLRQGDCTKRVLLQNILRAACTPELLPVWVGSHANHRKKDRNTWTHQEWGNHLADRLADWDLDDMATGGFQPEVMTVSSQAFIKGLLIPGEWY